MQVAQIPAWYYLSFGPSNMSITNLGGKLAHSSRNRSGHTQFPKATSADYTCIKHDRYIISPFNDVLLSLTHLKILKSNTYHTNKMGKKRKNLRIGLTMTVQLYEI